MGLVKLQLYYGNYWVYLLLLEDKRFSKHRSARYIFRPSVNSAKFISSRYLFARFVFWWNLFFCIFPLNTWLKRNMWKFQNAARVQIAAHMYVVFKLGWAENTGQTSVAPVKRKMLLLCESTLLYFSVVRGSHPLTFSTGIIRSGKKNSWQPQNGVLCEGEAKTKARIT